MKILSAYIIGLVFGVGLILSGMTNPSKVIGFLDIAGTWDPSLALVMVGAISVAAIAFKVSRVTSASLSGEPFRLPSSTAIDKRLIIGGVLFGAGWGLAGYCPGPALASLTTGGLKPWIFFLAMLVGMAIFELLESIARSRKSKSEALR